MESFDINDIAQIKEIATKILFRHYENETDNHQTNTYSNSGKIIYMPNHRLHGLTTDEIKKKSDIDNLITNTGFKAAKKEDNTKMPPKFLDGSFRPRKYCLEYRFMHRGNQVSVFGKSEEICFQKRLDFLSGKKKKPTKTQAKKFELWIMHWFVTYKKPYIGEEWANSMISLINNILPTLGKYRLIELTHDKLQSFLNEYIDRPNRQKKLYIVLNASLKKARINRLIKFNPAEGLMLAKYSKKKRKALQIKEQLAIYDYLKEKSTKYLKVFMFACCTGIRMGRVLELTTEDIDLANKEIIVKSKQKKGLTEAYRVPFIPKLLESLPKQGKLFGYKKDTVKSYFHELFKRLDMDGFVFHSFRHTFISVLYYLGVSLKVIQTWAGHKTLAITSDTYTHILNNDGSSSPIMEYLKNLKKDRNV